MFDQFPLVLAQTGADAPPASKDKAPATTGSETPATGTPATGAPGSNPATPTQPQRAPGLFDQGFFFILLIGLAFMIFLSMRTQRKDRKKREELLGSLKKGDRIQTIGGLLGTVLEVREDRVIIKADENNNTKLTFVRASIQAVIAPGGAPDKQEPQVKQE